MSKTYCDAVEILLYGRDWCTAGEKLEYYGHVIGPWHGHKLLSEIRHLHARSAEKGQQKIRKSVKDFQEEAGPVGPFRR